MVNKSRYCGITGEELANMLCKPSKYSKKEAEEIIEKAEELTPLEVSKQLKDFVLKFVKNGLDRRFIHGSFNIIETALKKLEEINNYNVASGLGKYLDIIKYNLSEDVTSDLPEALEKVHAASLKLATLELKLGKDQLALKKLKALEIIKKKQVNVGHLLSCIKFENITDPLSIYNSMYIEANEKLTQEEFDLLKEVLK